MRARQLSRRALLAGTAAALTGCSASGPPQPPAAPPPDSPEVVLLKGIIAEKERTIALYSALVAGGAEKLAPFRDRHQAHLAELRKHVPAGSPSPSAPSGKPAKASLSRLREIERKAAAARPRQLAGVSPGVAQLVASIGACEAAHAIALPKSL
ncbi:unnamed protein product [[Actinomadura] parvosata subsp. kistnae]|uniref:DUF4439 domain-containing protein n=1 Tax=[Actinomadura] parvosata subsp. kistnae TaxID=1909395 RepID=A0A1V0A6J7_9ACTN|nr:hypothetical protein [Nonomuraea sp. ATCC 55076]AQZ65837.1 hypothetical protein BKM31_34155 [Nonomuraea sp. ATCC 55076]SPL97267.1 unnamed protein product [Actinomadura parvosata subsp. kistnae]